MPDPIDLDFRPEAYFRPHPLEDYLLSRVKGTLYRERLRQLLQEGRRDEVMAFIGPDGVPAEVRKRLEALHPVLMGGSYLPDAGEGEVEIGRIAIASTTRDVTSVYARRGRGRIRYRVVDEYDGDTLQGRVTRTSVRPLTLGQFTDFFLAAWPLHDVVAGYDLESALDFFVAESDFYPDFDALVRERPARVKPQPASTR